MRDGCRGYRYVNIDDSWMADTRDRKGNLQPDLKKFPHGIKAVADYVHANGLCPHDDDSELSWLDTPEWDVEDVAVSGDGRVLAWLLNVNGASQLRARNLVTGLWRQNESSKVAAIYLKACCLKR